MADPKDVSILTAVLTIIGGVTIYVIGQIISKFFIEPYHKYRETVGEIAYTLVFYANVSAGTKEERQNEAWSSYRQNASRLRASAFQIPGFKWLPRFKSVMKASSALIGLSNSVYGNDWDNIHKRRNEIVENLRLKGID